MPPRCALLSRVARGVQNERVEERSEYQREWLRPSSLLLVFIGGCVGAAAREISTAIFPQTGPMPIALLAINLIGAFFLGVLLEGLIRRKGLGAGRARLLLGTGLLGGFTSYSALALAVTTLVIEFHPWLAVTYGLGIVLVGALATLVGILAGAGLRRGGQVQRAVENHTGSRDSND